MDKLEVPVPPMLSDAIGYTHDAEWVLFQWEPEGDELRWADGRMAMDGDWHAYLTYTTHPAVVAHLYCYDLGSSERGGRHVLLLHRPTLELYAAGTGEAAALLRAQWTDYEDEGEEPQAYTPEQIRELAERVWEAEWQRQTFMLGRRQRAIEEMREWLDAQPVTTPEHTPTFAEVEEALRRLHGEL